MAQMYCVESWALYTDEPQFPYAVYLIYIRDYEVYKHPDM